MLEQHKTNMMAGVQREVDAHGHTPINACLLHVVRLHLHRLLDKSVRLAIASVIELEKQGIAALGFAAAGISLDAAIQEHLKQWYVDLELVEKVERLHHEAVKVSQDFAKACRRLRQEVGELGGLPSVPLSAELVEELGAEYEPIFAELEAAILAPFL